ncbi:MAG: hypothetical protein KDB07_00155 [Planctomycetes bacterium]|nr:hypothetical protein [Planctomycetota bacterium]
MVPQFTKSIGFRINALGSCLVIIPLLAIGWWLSESHYEALIRLERQHLET